VIQISNQIEIARPVDEVFAFVADFNNNPRWMPVLGVEQTSSGPVGAGTTFRQRFHMMGADYEMDCVITEFEPVRRISFRFVAPVFSWQGGYVVEPVPAGARVHARGTINLNGPFKMTETLFAPKIRRLINDTAPRLKQALEQTNQELTGP
jgi:uncharacterized protein YndB with AHSA1/START domain